MTDSIRANRPSTDEVAASPSIRKSLLTFVAVVTLLETALVFFLVPSAEQISALAEAQLINSVQQDQSQRDERSSSEDLVKEFKLGLFGETFRPLDSDRDFRVEIDVYGLVLKRNEENLEAEFAEKQGRLRHEVRKKIRNSELKELSENNLGLLERRILTTCNQLLGDDLLLGIGFNSYQLIEQ
jgi:hypothetical protein